MKIYMIRHGQTDWNKQGIFQGQEDIELNDTGREEARICGSAFQNKQIQRIWSSPLKRAKETADLIAEKIGLPLETVMIKHNLKERDFGKLSGQPYEMHHEYEALGIDVMLEDFTALQNRVEESLREIIQEHGDEDIIVVSHGATINGFLHKITEGTHGSGITSLVNTSINVIHYSEGRFQLEHCNLTPAVFKDIDKG